MLQYYSRDNYKAKNSIGYLVRRARNLISARIENEFAEHEITFAQWIVLMNLRDGLSSTAAEIARDMCHDTGALTRVIDQLAQRGFITRQRRVTDRRAVELKLTDGGRRMVNSLVPLIVDMLNVALSDFTKEEADTLTRLLAKLVASDTNFLQPAATKPEPLP